VLHTALPTGSAIGDRYQPKRKTPSSSPAKTTTSLPSKKLAKLTNDASVLTNHEDDLDQALSSTQVINIMN
jgi:hypothetical protein